MNGAFIAIHGNVIGMVFPLIHDGENRASWAVIPLKDGTLEQYENALWYSIWEQVPDDLPAFDKEDNAVRYLTTLADLWFSGFSVETATVVCDAMMNQFNGFWVNKTQLSQRSE